MAECILIKSGGGVSSDDVTVAREDIPKGLTALTSDSDDEVINGTMELTGNVTADKMLVGSSGYSTDYKKKINGNIPINDDPSDILLCGQSKIIPAGYNPGGTISAKDLASQTRGTAIAETIQKGKTATVNGMLLTGTMPERTASIITPSTSNQIISAGQRLVGDQTILGDPNLKPENIKKGVSIFGKTGSFQGYVDSPLYLFNNGVWTNVQTIGVTATKLDVSTGSSYFGLFKVEHYNPYKICRLNQKINVGSYKYIKIVCENTIVRSDLGMVYFGLSSDSNLQDIQLIWSTSTTNPNTKQLILDVSSVSGEYYFYFICYNKGSSDSIYFRINEIFLTTV